MHPLGRRRLIGRGRAHRWRYGRDGLQLRRRITANIRDLPDSAFLVISDVKGAVGSDRKTGGAIVSLSGLLIGAGKAIGENDVLSGGLAVREGLEHQVIAVLREG